MDEDLRRYERALQLSGKSPREVACGLLGVTEPSRFLLVVEHNMAGINLPIPMGKVHYLWQTDQNRFPSWWNGWSAPMLTMIEAATWSDFFACQGNRWMLWDQRNKARAFGAGMNASEVREGWLSERERQDRLLAGGRFVPAGDRDPGPMPTGGGGDVALPWMPPFLE